MADSRKRKVAHLKSDERKPRPDDGRKEIRAVWVAPNLMNDLDLCAKAKRWKRAAYALYALEEQVKRDLASVSNGHQPLQAAQG